MTPDAQDTICAISTAPGVGGIAVCRVSGPQAIAIVDRLWQGKSLAHAAANTAHLGYIVDPDSGARIDQCVATIFRAPGSYTGEDTVEIGMHGSLYVQQAMLDALCRAGCRLATAGEYTRRAFANQRLDLAQAEAVADLIAARTQAQHRTALSQMNGSVTRALDALRAQMVDLAALLELELDFSEEDVEFASRTRLLQLASDALAETQRLLDTFAAGQAIRQGLPVAIVGAPNAGKSSLLNALLGDDRAIVSPIQGTTRDAIQATAVIGGHLFRFIDTAGLRHTDDPIETLGIERTRRAMADAAIVLHLTAPDAPGQISADDFADGATVIEVRNKIDLDAATDPSAADAVAISALTGQGLDTLRQRLTQIAAQATAAGTADTVITNARHAQCLRNAADALQRTIDGLRQDIPADLVAQDLRQALHHLGQITGQITTPEILTTIFSRHCIGK